MDWNISDTFPEPIPTAFPQTDIYATLQCLTRVYTRLSFMKLAYEIQDTEVVHFQLPLGLLCLCCAEYPVLCHIFLTELPSSSIPSSMLMISPFGVVLESSSFIPLLYVQACYMHSILHVSYSFCSNQQICDHTYCKKNNIRKSTLIEMTFLHNDLEPFFFYI